MKDHDANDFAEAQAMALEARLRAFHASKEIMKPLAKAATAAGNEGSQKMRAMMLAIVVNNLINVFTKQEKHFPDALVAVFHDDEAREERKEQEKAKREAPEGSSAPGWNDLKKQMDTAFGFEEPKKATVHSDAEALIALKSLFDALDKTMATPSVKAKVSPGLQDKAAKLRKKYDDIVNGSETKAPR